MLDFWPRFQFVCEKISEARIKQEFSSLICEKVGNNKMLLDLLLYAVVSGILFYVFYKWATVNRDYFSKRRMKQMTPTFLVGNTFGLFAKRHVPKDFIDSIYYRYPNEKYVSHSFSPRISHRMVCISRIT